MKIIREEYRGSKVFCKSTGGLIEVTEDNIEVLNSNGKDFLFEYENELKPVKAKAKDTGIVDPLFVDLLAQSKNDFEGREPKEVKADLDKLGIEYPKRAGLDKLVIVIEDYAINISK